MSRVTIARHFRPPWQRAPRRADGAIRDAQAELVFRLLERGVPFDEAIRRSRIGGGSTAGAFVARNTAFSAATGAKTALVVASPSQHGLSLTEVGVSFNGTTASDAPATVEVTQLTLGGTGTAGGSPVSAAQVRGRTGSTAPTVTHNYTGEPTTHTVIRQWYVSPNGGTLIYPFPLGREVECDASGGTIKALAIRVNTSATVSVLAYMEVEALG